MKHLTRMVALALSLSMSLALVSCGNDNTSSSNSGSNQSSSGSNSQSGITAPDGYPGDTVNMIVSYAAGAGSDLLARALAKYIDLDGETMICTNIEGGSGTIGMMECYHAEPDGLTMCLALPESYSVQILNGSLPEDLFDNLIMVASPVYDVDTMAVKADSPYSTLEELLAYAKEHPGEVTVAGVGSGLNKWMAVDLMQKAGVELKYVPYSDANESRAAVLGGQADVLFSQACESKPYYDSGEMKILAIAAEERASFMEDVPTFTELGYEFVAGIHRGFAVTPGTPDEIVDYLEAKIKETYDNPEFIDYLNNELGFNTVWTGHDEYEALSRECVENFAPLLEVANNY